MSNILSSIGTMALYGSYSNYYEPEFPTAYLVVSVIVGLIFIAGYIAACRGVAQIAAEKGHNSSGVAVACFFFGIPYMVYVASLPDLVTRQKEEEIRKILEKNNILESVAEGKKYTLNGSWKCPNCGNTNLAVTGTCACGTHKPRT